jgi:hypothetical protein
MILKADLKAVPVVMIQEWLFYAHKNTDARNISGNEIFRNLSGSYI